MEALKALIGRIWTRFDMLLDDIESTGFYVDYATEDYITVSNSKHTYTLRLAGYGNTIHIERIE